MAGNSGRASRLRARAYSGAPTRKRGNPDQFKGRKPVITVQPENWVGLEGTDMQFTLVAISEDGSALTYQWAVYAFGIGWIGLADGGRINGAQSNFLTIADAALADSGKMFRCTACNPHTCVESVQVTAAVTAATYYIVSEVGTKMVDETAASYIVDERSL
ncbi:MAG: immunoglobulin domain-containing protein [Halioglobus sp.]